MFILISVLSVLFMAIAYMATTHFYEASTQLLNKDVAAHIAKFTSPFGNNGINKQKADSVFYNAMVINPNDEVYFLDTKGKVIEYQAADSLIKAWYLPLDKIKTHIQTGGTDYIKGPDPKDPGTMKIFSAAEVVIKGKIIGYIYVILASNQYRNVTDLLTGSHVTTLAIEAFLIIIVLSLLFTWLYFKRLQRNFNSVIATLDRFREGDYEARFDGKVPSELHSIMLAFNSLADRLHQTISQLKQSEDERKNFITNISHDLRTPLSVAKGYTETLLLQGKLSPEATEHLQLVEHKIQVVENLVMQLFELSKLESVEFKAQREPFAVAEVVKEIVTSWILPAQAKKITLECLGCETTYMIFADVSMMEKVIRNLIGNAVKYTPDNGAIKVELHKKGSELVLQFVNSGPAVTDDIRLWLNKGNANRPPKSGLGLAIVKRILELHDYELKLSTGKNNTFTIHMALYQS